MTVAISIKVHDGLVLASDSAVTFTAPLVAGGGQTVVNVYNNANKVFNLHRGMGIGGMVWGSGSIGDASIASLAKDLRMRFEGRDPHHAAWEIDPADYCLRDVAEKTREFLFEERHQANYRKEKDPDKKPSLGFMVAGYSAGSDFAEEWLIEIDKGKCPAPALARPRKECGWLAYAAQEPIHRLLFGYAPGLAQVLRDRFNVPVGQVEQALNVIKGELETHVVLPPMPIQDVIDLAEFMVQLSSMYYRFRTGTQIVGGPVDIAAITKHEGFKWIKRKYYYSRDLNPPKGTSDGTDIRQQEPAAARKKSARRANVRRRSR
jgi:hypothetical protein